jgi:hypothetical protein
MRLTNNEARDCGIDVPKDSKYGNRWTVVDGIKFQSAKEAQRWGELKLLALAGEIHTIDRQYPFRYWNSDNKDVIFTYDIDFRYYSIPRRQWVHEDVKAIDKKTGKTPMTAAYRMFRLKKALIEDRYGFKIEEV